MPEDIMDVEDIVRAAAGLDLPSLRRLNSEIVRLIKSHRACEATANMLTIQVGSRVRYVGRTGRGLVHRVSQGRVVERKRTRFVVRFDGDSRSWTCPADLIEAIKE